VPRSDDECADCLVGSNDQRNLSRGRETGNEQQRQAKRTKALRPDLDLRGPRRGTVDKGLREERKCLRAALCHEAIMSFQSRGWGSTSWVKKKGLRNEGCRRICVCVIASQGWGQGSSWNRGCLWQSCG